MIAASLRRRRGPLVRYWSADWRLVHAEPVRVESWRHWARALPGRLLWPLRRRRWLARHRRLLALADFELEAG